MPKHLRTRNRQLTEKVPPSVWFCKVKERESFVSQFHRDGYLLLPGVLTHQALQFLRRKVDQIYKEKRKQIHDEWVLSLHQMLPEDDNWMWTLATYPLIIDIVTQVLGPDVVLFSTQLATKRPRSGEIVPWHQDGERCVTLWLTLDDVDENNGSMSVLPGEHLKGRRKFRLIKNETHLEQTEFFQQYNLFAMAGDEEIDIKHAVTYRLPAGSLEMHDPLLPHSSLPNKSWTRTRRVIIMRYQKACEPLSGGIIHHWRDNAEMEKIDYLVSGDHPLLGTSMLLKRSPLL